MSDTNEALRRLVAQVGVNTDVLVGGTPVQARQLLAEASVALADQATVVSVASPIGELSLSTLIAQLAGRLDLDEQDDAVVELGFKRLQGDGQTVLMVLAPAGISRSALRYLQHVSRQSPRLAMGVYNAPSLAAMLEEPGFAGLRARLHASPAVEFGAAAETVTTRSVAVAPPTLPSSPPLSIVAARTRRPVLWAACAVGMAAIIGAVWLGRSAPGTAVAGNRTAHADVPLVPATIPLPVVAGLRDPVAADASLPIAAAASASPPLANPALTTIAKLPPIALATLPAQPPSVPPLQPDTVVAGLGTPKVRRLDAAKHEPSRFARTRPYWSDPRYQEPADQPWDGVSPIWVRRDPRRRDAPYLGTYAVGPNGVRVFQYDP